MKTNFKTKMSREKLLEEIERNRTKHVEQYVQALKTFKSEYISKLKEMIESIDVSKDIRMFVDMRTPECHEDDYTVVINMLRMSTEGEIEVDQTEFECYVMDKWPWRDSFLANTCHYLQ
jgi:hypothetical protein